MQLRHSVNRRKQRKVEQKKQQKKTSCFTLASMCISKMTQRELKLTSLQRPLWWKLWQLPTPSTRHRSAGRAGLDRPSPRMGPTRYTLMFTFNITSQILLVHLLHMIAG